MSDMLFLIGILVLTSNGYFSQRHVVFSWFVDLTTNGYFSQQHVVFKWYCGSDY